MELDMPTHPHSVLKEHLHGIDKQKEIELYYELLSSGHSVGEILDSLGHIQCKSEHGNATTMDHPPSGFDRAAPDVMSKAVLMGPAQANTPRASGLTAPLEAKVCEIEESSTTESTSLNDLGSGTSGQFS